MFLFYALSIRYYSVLHECTPWLIKVCNKYLNILIYLLMAKHYRLRI